MDEGFTPRNLRRVWDLQTRRGRDLSTLYPDVARTIRQARDQRRLIRRLAGDLGTSPYDPVTAHTSLKELRQQTEDKLEIALTATSLELAHRLERGTFTWGLQRVKVASTSRSIYSIGGNSARYFAEKQLQRNVAALVPKRQQSRNAIVRAVAVSLGDALPKAVLKVDVEQFYESIPHSELRELVCGAGLTPTSVRLILMLIDEYAALTGAKTGLPTGVGLSAKLAELYIQAVDRQLSNGDDVIYYARFVDDIVVVRGLTRSGPRTKSAFLQEPGDALAAIGLTAHPTKSDAHMSGVKGAVPAFDLLGYEISRGPKQVEVRLSQPRLVELQRRLDRTFELWDACDQSNGGRQLLFLNRVRMLTGNTRLSNNKRNAMVGIYYSNSESTQPDQFDDLDIALQDKLSNRTLPVPVGRAIARLSFRGGFEQKTMHRFSADQLRQIRGAWR
ncbi:antiviral reverse transcriptase Drt3a [Agromyces sp. NPDC058136]|uniref:antiviral reverse transcriptase Drt3a n=1 Tax=Agromyces sp. NPDC058136 TaxID=3346354 RepID=UPI0036DCFAC1